MLWLYTPNYRDECFVKANIYALAAFSGMGALLVVPAAPRASLFFPLISMITLGFSLRLLAERQEYRRIRKGVFCIVLLMFAVRYLSLYSDARKVQRVVERREAHILSEKAASRREITVPNMSKWSIYQRLTEGLSDLGNSPDDWENVGMAKFYGVDRIISTEMPQN